MAKSIQQYDEHGEKLYPFSLTTLVFDEKGEILEARLQAVEKLLEWFEMDNEEGMIKAKYGLYSVGSITAGCKRSSSSSEGGFGTPEAGGSSTLYGLTDVKLSAQADGQVLAYDAALGMWVNKTINSGGKVTQSAIQDALGYLPMDPADFSKTNIKSKLGISDWALASAKPSYSKSDVGLGNVTNLAASQYLSALSADTSNAVSITIGGTTKTIGVGTMRTALGLGDLAYKPGLAFSDLTSHPSSLADYGISKDDIKLTLGISDWALASAKPSYSKSDVGLGNVTNLAAADYFTELVSNATYPISITIGGQKKYIAASILRTSLGLKALAYKASLSFDDLTSHPTTLAGYGITDALGSEGIAVAAEKLANDSAFTIWGNTFFTGGKPKSVAGNIVLGNSNNLKIGGATLAWDSSADMLKIDKGVYSEGAITAKGVGSSSSASGPVWIDLDYIMSSDGFTDAQVASAGLTSDVINNLIAGKYTKVVYETQYGVRNVWDYSGNMTSEGDICLFFQQGDGFDVRSGISMIKSGAGYWQVLFGEI